MAPTHGWRNRFQRIADRVGIPEKMRDKITGHAPASVGRRYGPATVEDRGCSIAAEFVVGRGQRFRLRRRRQRTGRCLEPFGQRRDQAVLLDRRCDCDTPRPANSVTITRMKMPNLVPRFRSSCVIASEVSLISTRDRSAGLPRLCGGTAVRDVRSMCFLSLSPCVLGSRIAVDGS
jgi:hypothetical protein